MTADGSTIYGQVFNFVGRPLYTITSASIRFAKDWLSADYRLDLSQWTLSYINGISDNGKIVAGYGINSDGHTETWVTDLSTAPVPLLVGAWLMGTGLRRSPAYVASKTLKLSPSIPSDCLGSMLALMS